MGEASAAGRFTRANALRAIPAAPMSRADAGHSCPARLVSSGDGTDRSGRDGPAAFRPRKQKARLQNEAAGFVDFSGPRRKRRWSRRQESNLYLPLRRRPFYPLNYGESSGARSGPKRKATAGAAPGVEGGSTGVDCRASGPHCRPPAAGLAGRVATGRRGGGGVQRWGFVAEGEVARAGVGPAEVAAPGMGRGSMPGVPHFQVQIRSRAFSLPVCARKVKRWAAR